MRVLTVAIDHGTRWGSVMTTAAAAGDVWHPSRVIAAPRHLLVPVLLTGACLNGLIVRIQEAWQLHGFEEPLLGVSPFEIVAIVLGAVLLAQSEPASKERWPWLELTLAALLLLPSSSVTWFAIAAYATWRAVWAKGQQRTGFVLFLAVAACSIWSSVLLKWVADAAASLEAHIVWAMLAPWRPDIEVTGNVVGVPTGHNLVILIACTSASSLPKALLGTFALTKLAGGSDYRRLAAAMGLVAAAHVVFNLLRLSLMAWSGELHHLIHGPTGANVVDAVQTLIVVALAMRAART
jgi:hypothetical protein